MEKRRPTFDLTAFKHAFSTPDALLATGTAVRSAAGLGFGRVEIVATIQSMERRHFFKSMTAHNDHRQWQDVYHVPSSSGVLYVKFTADALTAFRLLSFKAKGDDHDGD